MDYFFVIHHIPDLGYFIMIMILLLCCCWCMYEEHLQGVVDELCSCLCCNMCKCKCKCRCRCTKCRYRYFCNRDNTVYTAQIVPLSNVV